MAPPTLILRRAEFGPEADIDKAWRRMLRTVPIDWLARVKVE
jgi:hypothetical protein